MYFTIKISFLTPKSHSYKHYKISLGRVFIAKLKTLGLNNIINRLSSDIFYHLIRNCVNTVFISSNEVGIKSCHSKTLSLLLQFVFFLG